MANVQELVTRTVSGKGLIKVPGTALGLRQYYLDIEVIRQPSKYYRSLAVNPEESFFGKIALCASREGNNADIAVLEVFDVKYSTQRWVYTPDVCGQALLSLKCVYDGILDTFVNFAVALNLVPFQRDNLIKEHEVLSLQWDTIKIQCFADTALQIKLSAIDYAYCKPEDKRNSPPPPPKPKQESPAASGKPLPPTYPQISLPYQPDNAKPENGDSGDTEPNPIDKPDTLPITSCALLWDYTDLDVPSFSGPRTTSLQISPKPISASAIKIDDLSWDAQIFTSNGGSYTIPLVRNTGSRAVVSGLVVACQ